MAIHCNEECNMLQWIAMLFQGTPYLVDDAEGFGTAVRKVIILFATEGVVIEFVTSLITE